MPLNDLFPKAVERYLLKSHVKATELKKEVTPNNFCQFAAMTLSEC